MLFKATQIVYIFAAMNVFRKCICIAVLFAECVWGHITASHNIDLRPSQWDYSSQSADKSFRWSMLYRLHFHVYARRFRETQRRRKTCILLFFVMLLLGTHPFVQTGIDALLCCMEHCASTVLSSYPTLDNTSVRTPYVAKSFHTPNHHIHMNLMDIYMAAPPLIVAFNSLPYSGKAVYKISEAICAHSSIWEVRYLCCITRPFLKLVLQIIWKVFK